MAKFSCQKFRFFNFQVTSRTVFQSAEPQTAGPEAADEEVEDEEEADGGGEKPLKGAPKTPETREVLFAREDAVKKAQRVGEAAIEGGAEPQQKPAPELPKQLSIGFKMKSEPNDPNDEQNFTFEEKGVKLEGQIKLPVNFDTNKPFRLVMNMKNTPSETDNKELWDELNQKKEQLGNTLVVTIKTPTGNTEVNAAQLEALKNFSLNLEKWCIDSKKSPKRFDGMYTFSNDPKAKKLLSDYQKLDSRLRPPGRVLQGWAGKPIYAETADRMALLAETGGEPKPAAAPDAATKPIEPVKAAPTASSGGNGGGGGSSAPSPVSQSSGSSAPRSGSPAGFTPSSTPTSSPDAVPTATPPPSSPNPAKPEVTSDAPIYYIPVLPRGGVETSITNSTEFKLQENPSKPDKLVILGDSLFEGASRGGLSGKETFNFSKQSKSTNTLMNELGLNTSTKASPDITAQLEKMRGGQAVILMGTNDLLGGGNGFSAEYVINNLKAIYKFLKNYGLKISACTVPPFNAEPHKNYANKNLQREKFNKLLMELKGTANGPDEIIPLHLSTKNGGLASENDANLFGKDFHSNNNVHPGNYPLMAKILQTHLAPVSKEKSPVSP